MGAVKAAKTRWIGIPERKELSWGEWPFCLLGVFTDSGHRLRIWLCSCRGSLLRERETQQGFRWSCEAGATDWKIEKLGWFHVASWVPQEAGTESEICLWKLTGESSQQHLRGHKRTRMLQKLNGDTYSFNSDLSQSPRELWSWDGHVEMSAIVARGLDLWTRINQSLDAGCPWGWGHNLGWSIFLQSTATPSGGCNCEPSADNTPGSWPWVSVSDL